MSSERVARPRAGRRRGESGASAIELALLAPFLLITITLVVQFAMYFHARHVALAAAREGSRVARSAETDWVAQARQRTNEYLEFIGGQLIEGQQIQTYVPAPNSRGVRVTGRAVQVVPFLTLRVVEESSGPLECFRSDVGTGAGCG